MQSCPMAAQETGSALQLESRQVCLFSPTLFNIVQDRIEYEPLDDHEDSVSIGGRLITIFRFADVEYTKEEAEADVLM